MDGNVRLWDLMTGNCVHKLEGHVGAVTCLTMTQQHVISAGSDDRLSVWHRLTGEQLHCIQMVREHKQIVYKFKDIFIL